jgi:hypothetical protein
MTTFKIFLFVLVYFVNPKEVYEKLAQVPLEVEGGEL